ncbi:hypothetical protein ACIRP0_27340 [Streptomyces sp. NPDC101733]|uniref:hypothetical protein n=1 Tax=unclassified Streptomyces TaxID=2593676 RepID=UPI0038226E82
MTVGVAASCGPRSWMRGRLVLALLVAGLLHVLGCSHGPGVAGRVDSWTAGVAPMSTGAVAVSLSDPAPDRFSGFVWQGPDHAEQCQGVDEPVVMSPRLSLATALFFDTPALTDCRAVGRRASITGREGPPPVAGVPVRAVLGIWRT